MQIIQNRQLKTNEWSYKTIDSDIPTGRFTVALDDWLVNKDLYNQHESEVGIRLFPADKVEEVTKSLCDINLIELDFSLFTEGRSYSQAKLLRDRYAYEGEIRAIGAHLDNLAMIERCGVNSFQLPEGADLDAALASFDSISNYY